MTTARYQEANGQHALEPPTRMSQCISPFVPRCPENQSRLQHDHDGSQEQRQQEHYPVE
ncbi:hypothetical protein [Thermogemmatispora sp.]|uniref:hypothetical protein n=1 Tax=Thermogemmatispora sp. TaxID=1968838 RepID=UPI0035E462B2